MQIYNYPKQNNISFEALNYKKFGKISVPDNFKVNLTEKNGNRLDCFVKSKQVNNPLYHDFRLLVTTNEKETGSCLFDYLGCGTFHVSAMNNFDESIRGVGSVLHLTHIISMLENNITETKLYSMGCAISFHEKLGFKSDIQYLQGVKSFLINEICLKYANNKRFSNVINRINSFFIDKKSADAEKIKCGNEIIDEFIQIINEDRLRYGVDYGITDGIPMNLKRETVLYNKEYYNNLLNKYGIDYQITD